MHIIATDGGSLATTQTVDDLVMAPGERRDMARVGAVRTG